MTFAGSIFLIAVGAILRFDDRRAVDARYQPPPEEYHYQPRP